MSKYLKSPDNMLTPNSLELIAHSYIFNNLNSSIDKDIFPERCFLANNSKELIQKMLNNSNFNLTMYGSADELAQNLMIYQNFPGSQLFFKTKFEPYTTTATIYRSLKNEEYIYKSDLFFILQNMAFDIFPVATSFLLHYVIFVNLRNEQYKLPHRMEFIKFDQKVFDEIEMEMREAKKLRDISNSELAVLGSQFAAGNFDSLVAKYVKLTKDDPDDIREQLKYNYSKLKTSNPYPAQDLVFLLIIPAIWTCLDKIINVKRPEMFLQSSTKKSPMHVRLFEDEDQQFVMESELAIAMFPEKASEIIIGRGKVGFHTYTTITLDEAIRKGAGRVEFIRYPIRRAKHRAVPIEGPDPEDPNDWCILAVDAFFEYMKSIITGFKIFQKNPILSAKAFDYIAPVFSALEKVFNPEVKSPYFVKIECVNDMLTIIQKNMNSFPNKDVRNANKEGFTAQDLKNELKYLGLTVTLPEILDYAEDAYEEIDKAKKERYLRTCDLFDAVESCQLICVLNRVPNLKKFLHNQKGCKRVLGYKCVECEKEKKTSDEVETMEISQQPAVVQKTSEHQNPAKKRKIETSNSSTPNQHSQPALSAPQICDKCSESSKSLENAENELKMSQDQQKKMVKELSDLKKEKEKIVESEAKKMEKLSKEKEEEILKASKKIEELEKANLKLTAENEANERMIEKLLNRLTN